MAANPYTSPENAADLPARRPFFPRRASEVLVIVGILLFLAALLIPGFGRPVAHEAARRMSCANNLRNIALALQQYESEYGGLPPAYTVDAEGKRLHSWRTLLLPFLEQKNLYKSIDLTKPWNDPANRPANETPLRIYDCPSNERTGKPKTTYLAIAVPGGCFQPTKPRDLADITDNKDLTLMVLEVPEEYAMPWMEPRDADEALISKLRIGDATHQSGLNVALVSGAVRSLASDASLVQLRALITIAGNDDNLLRDF